MSSVQHTRAQSFWVPVVWAFGPFTEAPSLPSNGHPNYSHYRSQEARSSGYLIHLDGHDDD
jgi:hypothetical protein